MVLILCSRNVYETSICFVLQIFTWSYWKSVGPRRRRQLFLFVSSVTMSPPPIRCRGPWRVHKRSSEPDRWLDEMGFFRKHIARDASCLFRIVSENVYNTQRYFHKVRSDCVQFMASQRHLFEGVGLCTLVPLEIYPTWNLILMHMFLFVVIKLSVRKLSQRDV